MTTARRTVELLAALLVGASAGWVLLAPLASNFAFGATETMWTVLTTSRPLAAALGTVLAAAVAGALSRRGSARATRLVTLLGLGLLVAILLVGGGAREVEWLIAVTYASGAAAGLALGGAAASVADRAEATALAGGATAAFLLAPLLAGRLGTAPTGGWVSYAPLTDAGTLTVAPAWWLLLPAAVATAAAALLGGARPVRPSTRALALPAAVVVAALATNAAIGAAPTNRVLTGALLAVFVAVVIAVAFALDGQDGTLLLTTTAIVAAAAPLTGWTDTTWVGIALLSAGLACGVLAGARWPSVVAGLTLLAAVSLIGLLPDVADGMGGMVRSLALAPLAGYALGSCGRVRSGAAIAGLSVLFVPSALTVAGQAAVSGPVESSLFTELPRGMLATAPPDPQALTLAMTVVALATIAAAGVLRQRGEE